MNPVFATAVKEPEPKQAKVVQDTTVSEAPAASYSSIVQFQRTAGNRALNQLLAANFESRGSESNVLQTKLVVGPPGDRYEQEADRVAEQVMRMPVQPVHKETEITPLSGNLAQRDCEDCEEELEERLEQGMATPIRRKSFAGAPPEVPPETENRLKTVQQGGQPLPGSVRSFFEHRLNSDFSFVRIHTDASTAITAKSLRAHAFTVGKDIVFAPGQYAPGTIQGKHLLAHELTHVVQQLGNTPVTRQATPHGSFGIKNGQPANLPRSPENSSIIRKPAGTDLVSDTPPSAISRLATPSTVMRAPEDEAEKASGEEQGILSKIRSTISGGLLGEFNPDPNFAEIGVDIGVSLIPILDQLSDIRDISAHIFSWSAKMNTANLCVG
jgi:hypothetical protein